MWNFFHQAKSASEHAADALDHARRIASSVYAPGFHAARKAGQGESFWQFRPYQPDDPRRDIDWRKSARSDATIIRQREDQRAQSINLWVDPNPGMQISYAHGRETKAYCAHVLTLALGFLALRQHDIARTIGPQGKAARSDQSMMDIAQSFNLNNLPPFQSLNEIPLRVSGVYVLAGDFLNNREETEHIFKAINHSGKKFLILQCLDPDEIYLPYKGRALFSGANQDNIQRIDHVQDIRAAYQVKIDEHLSELEQLCAAQNFLYLRHICGDSIIDSVNAAIHILNAESRAI